MQTWYQVKVKFSDIELESEIWKDISGYEGFYQVSNLGRVKSLYRVVTKSNGVKLPVKERILRERVDAFGYSTVSMRYNNSSYPKKIHQLVAIAFLGYSPDGTQNIVPDHFDENKGNNRLTNLQLITNRANITKNRMSSKKSSKYTGVNRHSRSKINPWQANIKLIGSSTFYLGSFSSEEIASEAYQKALLKFESDEEYYKNNIHQLTNIERKQYLLT